MIIINNINTKKFSLDGIPYFKNYISEVAGNSIRIFNAYDKNDIRVDYTNFANIELDGVVYGSVALLQDALLEVIYTRSSLGGGGGGGGAVDSVNGQTGVVVLDADDIAETATRKWQSANQDTYNDATSSIQTQLDSKQATLTEINFGTFANGLTAKTTLVDADLTNLVDSADSNKAKKVTWLNVWNYIKGKADAIYSSFDPRVQTVTSSATVTPVSTNDIVTITAQSAGLNLANPTGTFAEGQPLMIRIKDNGTARSITFGSNYRAIGITLPTTTVISKTLYLGIIYNSTDGKFDVLGINQQA